MCLADVDVQRGNSQEAMLAGPASCSPHVHFGCTVSSAFDDASAVSMTWPGIWCSVYC